MFLKRSGNSYLRLLLVISIVALTIFVAAVVGCASGDRPLEAVDPDSVPADPTWDQVFSIIQRECTPCHNDDNGKDEDDDGSENGDDDDDPNYETCEGVVGGLSDLYDEVFEKNTMPPGAWPRLTSEEKLIIQRWIDNGVKSPCTGN
ncbi:MAG: hypothetical protein JSW50_11075 [Candidatus Latescibacterota bacterium]|nr:MAG: hypothetical protein JSW50_11075 [Candidatus Latescibacterota bacterium]